MLVIVESPNKTHKIRSYLGNDYEVIATNGHFRDLPKKHLGNLPEKWQTIRGKTRIIQSLKQASKRHPDGVILATDPDREGEGIAWHVCDILGLDPSSTPRAVFHEITKDAICEGVRLALQTDGPRLDQSLVGAQKARRLIDRRIGYSGTRYLWNTIGGGVSAGRCLIPAAKLLQSINAQEDEKGKQIVVRGEIKTSHGTFRLHHVLDNSDIIPTTLQSYLPGLELDTSSCLKVTSLKTSQIKHNPPQPLDTAAAMSASGSSPTTLMRTLQSLFEKGLITYHRTTSRVVSDVFRIAAGFPGINSESSGAHEAIRPAILTPIQTPQELGDTLDEGELSTYTLIWKHALGSLYPAWEGERLHIHLEGGWKQTTERSTSMTSNWMSATQCEPSHDYAPEIDGLDIDTKITINAGWIRMTEEPVGRGVTESGMVQVLKQAGIGRPSTYSTIISNLSSRGLAGLIQRKTKHLLQHTIGQSSSSTTLEHPVKKPALTFRVTDTGDKCIQTLDHSNFSEFFQVEYTTQLESILDMIANDTYDGGLCLI
jgi:DNA topoisomerase-1